MRKWGCMDASENEIIPTICDWAEGFSEDFAKVKKDKSHSPKHRM